MPFHQIPNTLHFTDTDYFHLLLHPVLSIKLVNHNYSEWEFLFLYLRAMDSKKSFKLVRSLKERPWRNTIPISTGIWLIQLIVQSLIYTFNQPCPRVQRRLLLLLVQHRLQRLLLLKRARLLSLLRKDILLMYGVLLLARRDKSICKRRCLEASQLIINHYYLKRKGDAHREWTKLRV